MERRFLRHIVLPLALALAPANAACGPSGSPPGPSTSSTTAATTTGAGGAGGMINGTGGGASGGGGNAGGAGPCTGMPGPAPEILDEGHWFPLIALDQSRIYWAQQGLIGEDGTPSTIDAVPLDCSAPAISGLGMAGLGGLASDGTLLYWSAPGGVGQKKGRVFTLPVTGGLSSELLTGLDAPDQLALDGDQIYWIDSLDGGIRRAPKAGGAPVLLAPAGAPPVSGGAFALDASHVYWIDSGTASIRRVPRAGGNVETLVTGEPRAIAVAVTPVGVVWLRESSLSGGDFADDGEIAIAPLGGGSATTLATGLILVHGLAADASHAYVTARGKFTGHSDQGTVSRVSLSGGPLQTLASGEANPEAILVDETAVYWTDRDAGRLYRRAK